MRSVKSLTVLALLTLGLVAVAFVLVPRDSGQGVSATLLFEGLSGRINDVVAIEVRNNEGAVTIRRGDTGWVVRGKHDYPADEAKVRSLVLGLAESRVIEPKTGNPDFYHRLGLLDLENPESTAVEMHVRDVSDTVLASLLVGDAVGVNRYVRRASEGRSLLVSGIESLEVEQLHWLDSTILDIPPGDIQSLEIRHPDEVVRIERDENGILTLLDIPPGKQVAYQFAINDFASTFARLKFQDVRLARELDFETDLTGRATISEGLNVEFRVASQGDARWLQFSAQAIDEASPDTRAHAERLNTQWHGWAYRLDDTDLGRLEKRSFELLEDVDAADSSTTSPESAD
jgi:hypothetical protein